MKYPFIFKPALIGLLALFILSCGPADTSYILDIKGNRLNSDLVIQRYRVSSGFHKNEAVDTADLKQFIEDHLIENLLFQAEARDMGLLKDERVLADLEREKKVAMVRGNGPLFEKVVPKGFPVSEADVAALYENSTHKVMISHILVNSPVLADKLYEDLMAGADVSKLAHDYSVDLKNAAQGGIYRYFITPGTMPAIFDEAVFPLEKGQVTKPFKIGFQYHLVKILEKEPIHKKSLAEEEEVLTQNLENRQRRLHIEKYLNQLFSKYQMEFNNDAVAAILRVASKGADSRNLTKGNFAADELKMQLMSTTVVTWTVDDFFENYKKIPQHSRMRLLYPEDVFEFVRSWSVRDLMYQEGLEMKLDRTDAFKTAVHNAEQKILEQHYRQRFIQAQAAVFDADVQEYFNKHQTELNGQSLEKMRGYISKKVQQEKYINVLKERKQELMEKFDINYHQPGLKFVQTRLTEIKDKANAAKAKKAAAAQEEAAKKAVSADTTQ